MRELGADLQRLRWTAEGARSVADGSADVLSDATNIERAADEIEALRSARAGA